MIIVPVSVADGVPGVFRQVEVAVQDDRLAEIIVVVVHVARQLGEFFLALDVDGVAVHVAERTGTVFTPGNVLRLEVQENVVAARASVQVAGRGAAVLAHAARGVLVDGDAGASQGSPCECYRPSILSLHL